MQITHMGITMQKQNDSDNDDTILYDDDDDDDDDDDVRPAWVHIIMQ